VSVRSKTGDRPLSALEAGEPRAVLEELHALLVQRSKRIFWKFDSLALSDRHGARFREAHPLSNRTKARLVADETGGYLVLRTKKYNPERDSWYSAVYVVGVDDTTGKLFVHRLQYSKEFEADNFLDGLTVHRVRELMGFTLDASEIHLAKPGDAVRVQGDLAFEILRTFGNLDELVEAEVDERVRSSAGVRAIEVADLVLHDGFLQDLPADLLRQEVNVLFRVPGVFDVLRDVVARRRRRFAHEALVQAFNHLEEALSWIYGPSRPYDVGEILLDVRTTREELFRLGRSYGRMAPPADALKSALDTGLAVLGKIRDRAGGSPGSLNERQRLWLAVAEANLRAAETALSGTSADELAERFLGILRKRGLGKLADSLSPSGLRDPRSLDKIPEMVKGVAFEVAEREIRERDAERIRREVFATIRDHEARFAVRAGNHTMWLVAVDPFEARLSVAMASPTRLQGGHVFLVVRPQTIVVEHPEHGRREVPVGRPMVIAVGFLRRHRRDV